MKKELISFSIVIICLVSCIGKGPVEAFPVIIEVIGNQDISAGELEKTARSNDRSAGVYQWNNRWVLYGSFSDYPKIRKQILKMYPEATIKRYDRPFYVFDRSQCNHPSQAEQWSHTIMTANLVDDDTLQAEYMDYHARQRELFPEVAQGFCRADFQQLLLFRNGRQLMLVISIPEGKTLDELNPKTTENNPRVDEWNTIMSKYQTGIEGTKLDETWVIFNICYL